MSPISLVLDATIEKQPTRKWRRTQEKANVVSSISEPNNKLLLNDSGFTKESLMPKDLSSVKAKVIQLRVTKHLSLREIHEQTGVPKGTLSNWLKPYPLPEDVRQAKQAVAYEKLQNFNQNVRKRPRQAESKFYKVLGDRKLTTYQKSSIAEAAVLFRLVLY